MIALKRGDYVDFHFNQYTGSGIIIRSTHNLKAEKIYIIKILKCNSQDFLRLFGKKDSDILGFHPKFLRRNPFYSIVNQAKRKFDA